MSGLKEMKYPIRLNRHPIWKLLVIPWLGFWIYAFVNLFNEERWANPVFLFGIPVGLAFSIYSTWDAFRYYIETHTTHILEKRIRGSKVINYSEIHEMELDDYNVLILKAGTEKMRLTGDLKDHKRVKLFLIKKIQEVNPDVELKGDIEKLKKKAKAKEEK